MAWDIVYLKDSDGGTPAVDFLDECPSKVAATMLAVLGAVAHAPPPMFSGGGKWEAMHGDMGGYYEVRCTGPNREQYRLFCILDNASKDELKRRGLDAPSIAVITGMRKAWRKTFSARDYSKVKTLGKRYKDSVPRSVA